MFCYQAAAYRRNDGLASLITFGSPVDTRAGMPFGIPEQFAVAARRAARRPGVPRPRALPGVVQPQRLSAARPGQVGCAAGSSSSCSCTTARRCSRASASAGSSEADGWVAWPGPALAEFVQPVRRAQPDARGRVRDRRPAAHARRHRAVRSCRSWGPSTRSRRPPGVRAIRRAAPRADVYELALPAGHFGLVVGSTANRDVADGRGLGAMARRGGRAARRRRPRSPSDARWRPTPRGPQPRSATGSSWPARSAPGSRGRRVGAVRRTAARRARARPRGGGAAAAARAPRADPAAARGSRSGCWSRSAGAARPTTTFFLFEDRAYSAGEVDERIDNVVRGPDLDRRAPGRARRRADGRPPERAGAGGRAQPARRGGGAAAARRRHSRARRARAGASGSSPTPSAPRRPPGLGEVHTFVLGGGGGAARARRARGHRHGADRSGGGGAAGLVSPRTRAAPRDLAFIVFSGEGERPG